MKPEYSMRRGYRILYLHCDKCDLERPFYRVNSWSSPQKKVIHRVNQKFIAVPSPHPILNISLDDRLVHATCMICGTASLYVVSTGVLNQSRNSMNDLCSCGLPLMHVCDHLGVLRGEAN